MLRRAPTYDALRAGFAWDLPARLNMAEQACDRWVQTDPDRVAIIDLREGRQDVTFGALYAPRPGCLGRAVPGFDVAVLDETGAPTHGEGDIAVRRGCASMMLGYWNNKQATAEKFRGDWLLTGDRGVLDPASSSAAVGEQDSSSSAAVGDDPASSSAAVGEQDSSGSAAVGSQDSFIRFVGREDDVITSAGYRIGPSEIEDCLLTHPSVATVGVVGKPDTLRTQIVKAYVVLKPGAAPDAPALQDWVKQRLAAHSYPREIGFVEALPMTVTGKVIRKALKRMAAQEAGHD